jgi:hypothetical protein
LTSPEANKASLFRRLRGRAFGDASLCLLILIGCQNGDFGRVRPSLVTDGIHNWVGRDADRGAGNPISLFPLTDDEILLRDYAYQFIEPPYDRQRWYSVLGEWGMTHYFKPEWYRCDETAYAGHLMNAYVRSEFARYARLDDDMRNDITRLDYFLPVARRVLDIDGKRDKSLGLVGVLSGPESANAKARIVENILVVAWVQQALADRAASYRFALERLLIAVPYPAAVDVERSLTYLQTRIGEATLVTPPAGFVVAGARAPVPPLITKARPLVTK